MLIYINFRFCIKYMTIYRCLYPKTFYELSCIDVMVWANVIKYVYNNYSGRKYYII
jgi:hypothetical protein